MGISFKLEMRIAGYRPSVFKNALRGFMRTESSRNMIDLKSVFPLRRHGAIVFEECLDRGLLIETESGLKVSAKGEAIAHGRAKPRTPLARAEVVLDNFLQNIDRLNQDPEAVRYIDEVWLFGSLMRGEGTVGDIDLALKAERRPEYLADYDRMERHLEKLLSRHDNVPTTRSLIWSAEAWVTERALYGAKRHPLLAGVQDGISELLALGVPCRLLYDRSRGGRVSDPILPRHPLSNGRRNDLAPPAEMPALTPSDIRPMDGRWIAGYCERGDVSPYQIFRGWTDEAHELFPNCPEGLRVIGDGHDLRNYPWVPKRLKSSGLDGRNAVALVNATPFRGTSTVLRRWIEKGSATWTLHAGFEELEFYRRRKRPDPSTFPEIAAAVALILAVDAERMLRRAAETPLRPTVKIDLDRSMLEEDINACFVEAVYNHLQTRRIQIEHGEWDGSSVTICQCSHGN